MQVIIRCNDKEQGTVKAIMIKIGDRWSNYLLGRNDNQNSHVNKDLKEGKFRLISDCKKCKFGLRKLANKCYPEYVDRGDVYSTYFNFTL